MKYLKRFNETYSVEVIEKSYSELKALLEPFTHKEYTLIDDIFKTNNNAEWNEDKYELEFKRITTNHINNSGIITYSIKHRDGYNTTIEYHISILKNSDEWYYINYGYIRDIYLNGDGQYIKCDQIDSLLHQLNIVVNYFIKSPLPKGWKVYKSGN